MVVGKLLGEASLGIYSVAYKISSLPVSEVSDVFSRVTFPLYVKMVKNPSNLKKVYFKTLIISSLLMILMGVGIFIFAKPLVLTILGPNWLDAVNIIKILSIFGIIKGISTQSQAILFSLEKQKHVAVITLIGLLGLFISIIPLTSKFGLNGTAVSVIIGSLVTIPSTIYYINHSFNKLNLPNI
jgi:O-antigen/teichoic acid export membrane protein